MARGVNSVVRIKAQSALNTAAAFSAADKIEVTPFTSESFKASVTQVASQALRRVGERQKKLTRMGTLDVGGSITVEPTNNALANLLPILFPADGVNNIDVDNATAGVQAAAAPNYAKVYTVTSTERPYATVVVDDGDIVRAYANMRASSFSINASVNQLATLNIDFIGTNFQTNAGGSAAAWTGGITGNVPQVGLAYASPAVEYGLYFDQAKLEVGTAIGTVIEIPVTDFSLSVNTNASGDRYRLGSRFRRDVPTGVADVTGSFTMDANYNPNGAGLTTKDWAYQALQNSTYIALKVSFTDPTNTVTLGGSTVGSSFVINLPFIYIDTPDWNVSDDGIISGGVNFTSYADGATGLSIEHRYKLDT